MFFRCKGIWKFEHWVFPVVKIVNSQCGRDTHFALLEVGGGGGYDTNFMTTTTPREDLCSQTNVHMQLIQPFSQLECKYLYKYE